MGNSFDSGAALAKVGVVPASGPLPPKATLPDLPWKQTISGRRFPLVGFTVDDVDFSDMTRTLARLCRYGGAVPGNPYSVAQHCCLMADAALEEFSDAGLAAHCLLHDGHEYVFGDLTTPVAHWLAELARELFGCPEIVTEVIRTAKARLDVVIWQAAGLPAPGATWRDIIADFDLRMLATEQRQLLMTPPASWGAKIDRARSIRMRGGISPWSVGRAEEEFAARLEQLCPTRRV